MSVETGALVSWILLVSVEELVLISWIPAVSVEEGAIISWVSPDTISAEGCAGSAGRVCRGTTC